MNAGKIADMRFAFVHCATLPRLGWCAHIKRGSNVASVYHGPWVETRDDWFVEGAWTGAFEKGEIDRALFNVGSGGVIRSGRAVFCTPTDMMDRLYSLRTGSDLFISTSLAFVLTMAGDELDPCYPFYSNEFVAYFSRKHKSICTRLGRWVDLHDHCQIAVSNDLRIVRIEKPAFSRPRNFGDYVSMLQGVMSAVLENAASPARRHRHYAGLAAVSRGYDSNALAVLLVKLGVREAMTFYNKMPGDDSGEEVARILGMTARVYSRTDFRTTPGVDEAEFLSHSGNRNSEIVLAPCEEQLVGKVLITGRYGDMVLGKSHTKIFSDFRFERSANKRCSRMIEFRSRIGFLSFNPFYAGGLHLQAMREIATSQEMQPWRLGGNYDRPIARRIIEEAGVPRGMFGVTKAASAFYRFMSLADMSPAGRTDFESYRRAMPRPGLLRGSWYRGRVLSRRGLERLRPTCEWVAKMIQSFWWTGGVIVESLIPAPWRYGDDDMNFAVHWGQARVSKRYAEAAKVFSNVSTQN